jgi:hypothetical protein
MRLANCCAARAFNRVAAQGDPLPGPCERHWKPKVNLSASIHRRLLDGARERGEDFQLTLLRFGAERLLYRIGRSSHARDFVLKGSHALPAVPDLL